MRRYLLDTCAMGDLINRRRGVHEKARAARLGGARLGTCVPVLGELFFGIEFSQTRDQNTASNARIGYSAGAFWARLTDLAVRATFPPHVATVLCRLGWTYISK